VTASGCGRLFSKTFATIAPNVKLTIIFATAGTEASELKGSIAKVADKAVLQIPVCNVIATIFARGTFNNLGIKNPANIGIANCKITAIKANGNKLILSRNAGSAFDMTESTTTNSASCDNSPV